MSSLAASGKRTIVFALSCRPSISLSEIGNETLGMAPRAEVRGRPPAALMRVRSSGFPMVVFQTPGATSVQRGVVAGGIAASANWANAIVPTKTKAEGNVRFIEGE